LPALPTIGILIALLPAALTPPPPVATPSPVHRELRASAREPVGARA
jgi:hypothetical protein